jgi:hypothetical protein
MSTSSGIPILRTPNRMIEDATDITEFKLYNLLNETVVIKWHSFVEGQTENAEGTSVAKNGVWHVTDKATNDCSYYGVYASDGTLLGNFVLTEHGVEFLVDRMPRLLCFERVALKHDMTIHIDPNVELAERRDEGLFFSTMTDAYEWVHKRIDLQGYKVKFKLSAGEHKTGLNPRVGLTGGHVLHIEGTGSDTQTGTFIRPVSQWCIHNAVPGLEITAWKMRFGGEAGVQAHRGGRIVLGNGDDMSHHTDITFEAVSSDHVLATYMGLVDIKHNYSIEGGCSTHLHAYSGGIITVQTAEAPGPVGVTNEKDPEMDRFIGVADAAVVARGLWVSGTIRGSNPIKDPKYTYLVHKNGFADLSGAHLPGPGGTSSTGGVVIEP